MTVDLFIAAISLAMALGTIWGAPNDERRRATIASAICGAVLITALSGYRWYDARRHEAEVADMAELVLREINEIKTFDDVFTNLNFPSFDLVNDAFDQSYATKKIRPSVVDGKDLDGKSHRLRLFSKL